MILGTILVRFCSLNDRARIVPNFDRPDYAIFFATGDVPWTPDLLAVLVALLHDQRLTVLVCVAKYIYYMAARQCSSQHLLFCFYTFGEFYWVRMTVFTAGEGGGSRSILAGVGHCSAWQYIFLTLLLHCIRFIKFKTIICSDFKIY
jgi:hypothetical protein